MLPNPCDWIIISRGTNCVPSASLQVKSLTRSELARKTRICFVRASTKPKAAVDARYFIAKDGHDLRRRCSLSYPVDKMEKHRRLRTASLLQAHYCQRTVLLDSPPSLQYVATKFLGCRHLAHRVSSQFCFVFRRAPKAMTGPEGHYRD